MFVFTDPQVQLALAHAELTQAHLGLAQARTRITDLEHQLAHEHDAHLRLAALSRRLLEYIQRSTRHVRGPRSERRPLTMPALPHEVAQLLSPELMLLLDLVLPHLGTPRREAPPPTAAALPMGSADEVAHDDPAPPDARAPAPPPEQKTRRRHAPGSGRRALPAAARRTHDEILPDAAALICPACQRALRRIGARVTEQWDWVPDSYVVHQLVRPEFACAHCKGAGVVCAALPPQPIEGSHASAGLLAHVVVSKFLDGLPLYRQSQIAAREGVALGRNTLCRWLSALGPAVRTLVDRVLVPAALRAPLLHTDATGLPVLAARQVRLGHAFVYLGPQAVALFRFAPAHTTASAREVLGPYGGRVVCDGATIYDALFEGDQATRRAGCWSHARHHFVEARPTDPARADQALAWIGDLFAIDTRTAGLPAADRTGARAAAVGPVLAELSAWLARELPLVPPRSPIARAMRYVQRQWGPLTRFVTCGSIPLTNNAAERQLRRLKLGVKNWLFVGSDLGAHDAMAWLSLLATCIVRGIEPWSYLSWLLARLPGWNQRRLDELSPWAFQQAQQPQAQVA